MVVTCVLWFVVWFCPPVLAFCVWNECEGWDGELCILVGCE